MVLCTMVQYTFEKDPNYVHSGLKATIEGILETMLCRIVMLMWSVGPLLS